MTEKTKTSATIYKKDLKWLHKRKIEQDHDTLAETFQNLREKIEKLEDEESSEGVE